MNDYTNVCMKEAAEMLAEQKRKKVEYCEKITTLADSILETRIKVDELMVDQLMDYYGLDSSLANHEVWTMAVKEYYEEGTTGLYATLVKASDWLRLECHRIRTAEIRTFM